MIKEKVIVMMEYFLQDTIDLIERVVEESSEDPHCSAVQANKRLELYLELMNEFEAKKNVSSVEDIIRSQGYGEDFAEDFLRKLNYELEIYHGETKWEWNK